MITTNELQSVYNLDRKLQNYKQVLEDIKNIANAKLKNCQLEKKNCLICSKCNELRILDKINEVLDDMEHNELQR